MTREEFKKAFEMCKDDKERWLLVLNNKNSFEAVTIDNDAIDVVIDDDNYVSFEEFGYVALRDLLESLDINADFV